MNEESNNVFLGVTGLTQVTMVIAPRRLPSSGIVWWRVLGRYYTTKSTKTSRDKLCRVSSEYICILTNPIIPPSNSGL